MVCIMSPLKHTRPQNEKAWIINSIFKCKCYCSILVTDPCVVNIAFQINL